MNDLDSTPSCYNCHTKLALSKNSIVSRSETCPSCNSDIRCCYNCKFYSTNSYNECKEPQADRVVDKNKSNFCDFFSISTSREKGQNGSSYEEEKEKIKKQLDSLFK